MRFSLLNGITLTVILLFSGSVALCAPPLAAESSLAPFELRDQYGFPHKISFPSTNVIVMTVADRKGSAQVGGWVGPIKEFYGERIAIEGIADMSKVPGPLRSFVRKQFRKRCSYPVMLDWEGSVARRFAYREDEANVFVITRDGRVAARAVGAVNGVALETLFAGIDLALSKERP